VVYLTGDVVSVEQKARAESVARTVAGVRRVVNTLDVRAGQGAGPSTRSP
jgi:osmotically-inducible protein OsmY